MHSEAYIYCDALSNSKKNHARANKSRTYQKQSKTDPCPINQTAASGEDNAQKVKSEMNQEVFIKRIQKRST